MDEFKEGDLIICRNNSAPSFSIYALVVKADYSEDILRLDCYQDEGRFHYGVRNLSLSKIEANSYYSPMKKEEAEIFRQSLEDSVASSKASHNIHYDAARITLAKVCDSINRFYECTEQTIER